MKIPYEDIFRRLIRIRLVEEAIALEYPQQQMRCPVHLCLGQEAISAGAAAALTKDDALWGTHRSHGPYIGALGDVYAFFAELYGKADGCCAGRGGSMHLIDKKAGFWGAVPIVGSTIPIATGAALAFAMKRIPRVSMIIFGEGATEEGVFHESVQFAVLKKLPIVYVCENNRFAVNTPWEQRRPKGLSLTKLASAHGMKSLADDGNDVFAVYKACAEAVHNARNGEGPAFLEFETYRWVEHCGPYDDHHLPCRSAPDFAAWKERCPVHLAEQYLIQQQAMSPEVLTQIRCEESERIQTALSAAQKADLPAPQCANSLVYAEGGANA